ncbi:cytochrome P450 [Kitasatospora sp. NPDC001527]|uniref:cytochrome P450 n=1 Tax=Kitasatospora sp. NPDC001527 TaxID=3154519 RepID=UPI00331ACC84
MPDPQTPSLLNLFSPEWSADPYGVYAYYRELREASPVYYDEWMRTWVVLGYDEISRLSKDERLSGARIGSFHEQLPSEVRAEIEPLANALSDMMLFNEPPRHTRLRRLVKPGLTPRLVREMRPAIEKLADELLDRAEERGGMDVVHDFSEPLTRGVIARLAGVPEKAGHLLENWPGLLHEFFTQSRAEIGRITELRTAFEEDAEGRRNGTAQDLFTQMIAEQLQYGDYSDDEIFANFLLLIDAGQATTTHLIGNAVLALAHHPDQAELLRQRPDLGVQAAHELLRYDSSVQFTTRVALTALEAGGHRIPEGDSVTLVLGSGNRDPLHYAEPDRLDITRRAADHLSFGHGIHYCLGASLAVAEIDVALRRLLERTGLRQVDTRPQWMDSINFRMLKRLPVTFERVH